MLMDSGKWNPPESNPEIEEAKRWYMVTMKWRKFSNGVAIPITIDEIKSLYSVYQSALDIEYLADLINAIDDEFITQRLKQVKAAAN